MPNYDTSHFDPPAPVARVVLRNPQSGATVADVLLLVDTGADVTLLPRTAVEWLGVPLLAAQRYALLSFDGSKSFAPVVMVARFAEREIRPWLVAASAFIRDKVKACFLPEGGAMSYPYNVPEGYAEEEITAVIAESIASHLEFAQRRLSAYQLRCSDFEQRHRMNTEEFLERFEAGTLGDQQEWFDWYAAAQGKKIWSRKRDILARLK